MPPLQRDRFPLTTPFKIKASEQYKTKMHFLDLERMSEYLKLFSLLDKSYNQKGSILSPL